MLSPQAERPQHNALLDMLEQLRCSVVSTVARLCPILGLRPKPTNEGITMKSDNRTK